MASMGRPAVFRNKSAANNIHGRLTDEGMRLFERHRKALAKLVEWKPERVGDSDVIEFLTRGDKGTQAYLKSGKLT